jgi:hypothetical protein
LPATATRWPLIFKRGSVNSWTKLHQCGVEFERRTTALKAQAQYDQVNKRSWSVPRPSGRIHTRPIYRMRRAWLRRLKPRFGQVLAAVRPGDQAVMGQ